MLEMLVVAILAGIAGLVAGELIDGVRRGTGKLHDWYHE
ncbi:MAG: hypothetical protein JWR40_2607 [Massilia sp.]|jgi:hypothetical protein|nr:hypothetical protein [Massilia sp.]MDB5950141.1 hypothetical protein [Massilia sp.]